MLGMSREKGLVGLDIGSYSIKAVELKARKKGGRDAYEVARIGYEPLPHDAIVEGTIIDSAAVVETIRLLFDENKISNKDIVISISGNSVIIKKISLPSMERQELAESIIWEAKHNIPYPYEETNVDYAVLNTPGGGEDRNLDILLVAAKKDKIANYSNVVNQARKNLQAIEVDVFALQNALEINYPEILLGQDRRPHQHGGQHHQRRHHRAGRPPAVPRPVPRGLLLHREHAQGAEHPVRGGREAPQGHPRARPSPPTSSRPS